MVKKGLGKGLGALLDTAEPENTGVKQMKINEIEPNTGQPRKYFDDEKLSQLADSIKIHGVVQPLIIKKEDDTYKIVAGERRWRAARLAGLDAVPVIVKDLSNKQVMEIALIENIQREDLNPIEEAEAYERLINEFDMTQEEVATAVGKSRPSIANSIRLLSLNDKMRGYIINGQISSGHGKVLLSIDDSSLQTKAVEEIISKGLNVRETEKLAKRLQTVKKSTAVKKNDAEFTALEDRFREIMGTRVKIIRSNKSGKIVIEYYSADELDRITELIESMAVK